MNEGFRAGPDRRPGHSTAPSATGPNTYPGTQRPHPIRHRFENPIQNLAPSPSPRPNPSRRRPSSFRMTRPTPARRSWFTRTAKNDSVTFLAKSGKIDVRVGGKSLGLFANVSRIVASGGDGNDELDASGAGVPVRSSAATATIVCKAASSTTCSSAAPATTPSSAAQATTSSSARW